MSEKDPLTALLMDNPPEDVFDMRRIMDGFMLAVNTDLPEIGGSEDDVLIQAHAGQDLTVDIHRPKGQGPFPVLIYLHGGGWILGSPKTHRRLGHRFAERGVSGLQRALPARTRSTISSGLRRLHHST